MLSKPSYNASFYQGQSAGSIKSARYVLDLLFKIYRPDSIVDVGCGAGSWLAAAEEFGVTKLFGIDGEWVSKDQLMSQAIQFENVDFEVSTASFPRAELAISVEVAEHISEKNSDNFIALFCESADTLIFSAAIPRQGGLGHINEQPQSYWRKKIEARGFSCHDFFRPSIWDNENVEVWYRQNLLLFTKNTDLHSALSKVPSPAITDIVHPYLFTRKSLSTEDVDLLRDTALAIETSNLEHAYKLMTLAHRLRPAGKRIKIKVDEYEEKLSTRST
jgi:SAM-dependent methyltransferase